MRIVIVHADYLEPGGETVSAAAELNALAAAGHEVEPFFRSNSDFSSKSSLRQGVDLFYNREIAREITSLMQHFKPDIVHCNNLFPSLSPSVYRAAAQHGAATVQSLRNYRLSCPASTFFRDGKACYDCHGKLFATSGVIHGCYRNSRAATGGVAAMTATHRALRTWQRIDAYITLSLRSRELLGACGLPLDRMHVKFNVVSPEPAVGAGETGDFVFVARLTPEKGVRQVLDAAKASHLPVTIVGDGALGPEVEAAAARGEVTWIPHESHDLLLRRLGSARAVIATPLWDEPFGRTVAESLGCGTPTIVSAAGALPEFVRDGREGVVVPPGDTPALIAAMARMADADDQTYNSMRQAARQRYDDLFSPASNVRQMEVIYDAALAHRRETISGGLV